MLGRVLKYFYSEVWKQNKVYFVFLFINIICTSTVPFVNIILPKVIINEFLSDGNSVKIIGIVLIIIIGNFLMGLVIKLTDVKLKRCYVWFEKYFEQKLSKKVMEIEFTDMEDPDILNQIQQVEEGMGWYSGGLEGLSRCFSTFLSAIIILVGTSVIIANASPMLFVICLIAVFANAFVVGKINALEIKQFEKGPEMNRKFNYVYRELTETKYAKDIRVFKGKKLFVNIGNKALNNVGKIFEEVIVGKQKWGYLNSLISVLKNGCIYFYLAVLAYSRAITIGEFTMLISAASSFKDNLQKIIIQIQEMQKKANFMERYIQIMQKKDISSCGISINELVNPVIEFRNVFFKYPRTDNYILENVNITISSGEHLSIVGRNGAGKTTFIKLLCRLYKPTKGIITINGIDIEKYALEEYSKLLSVVFQDFQLFAMSIRENIFLNDSNIVTQKDENKLLNKSRIEKFINKFPYKEKTQLYKIFEEEGVELSGGQAQKIAIARAFYKNAPIVILDEPTAALDPIAEYEIYNDFNNLVKNKTSIFISHRLSSCRFCDRIAVFDNKTISEIGTHEELIQRGELYEELYRTQEKYYL